MKPSIGRVVHFHPTPDVTQAAIIAHVHSDTLVNLTVIDSNGNAQGKTSVQLKDPAQTAAPVGPYCEWMPFQIGQAQKQAEPVLFPIDKKTAEAMVRIIERIDAELDKEASAL